MLKATPSPDVSNASSSGLHEALRSALVDARHAYESQGVLPIEHLEATHPIATPAAPLYQAAYTFARGLPAHLPPGVVLYLSTHDEADGSVVLMWEARDRPHADAGPPSAAGGVRERLRVGPYGDLFELALLGLTSICRVTAGVEERQDRFETASSALLHREAPTVRRRYRFRLPGASSSSSSSASSSSAPPA